MKYIGLTIGPILKTLELARAAREFWSASYIFSYLMQEIIIEIKDKTGTDDVFLQPYTKSVKENKADLNGAGIIPDRILLKNENNIITLDDISEINKSVLSKTAKKIKNTLKSRDENKGRTFDEDSILKFTSNYFQIFAVEAEIDETGNPTEVIGNYLNTAELQNKFTGLESENYLDDLFYAANTSFLFKEAYPELESKRFDSLIEIATKEFSGSSEYIQNVTKVINTKSWKKIRSKNKQVQKEEEEILKTIKEFTGDKFKTYHKYIAIVKGDGDNIGASIKSLYKNVPDKEREIQQIKLQEQLYKFAKAAANEINTYQGKAVYIGGDDLLFFAPVKNGSKNILELLKKIDEKFDDFLLNNKELSTVFANMEKKPSMSYGISITYYKYPLAEALEQAEILLDNAKKHNNEQKNAIAYSVLKHSGVEFSSIIDKSGAYYKIFKNKILNINNEKDLLKSVIHGLDILKPALFYFINNDRNNLKQNLENLFENSYNEDIHTDKYKKYLEDIQELIIAGLKELHEPFNREEFDYAVEKIYGSLRFANFLLRKDYE